MCPLTLITKFVTLHFAPKYRATLHLPVDCLLNDTKMPLKKVVGHLISKTGKQPSKHFSFQTDSFYEMATFALMYM